MRAATRERIDKYHGLGAGNQHWFPCAELSRARVKLSISGNIWKLPMAGLEPARDFHLNGF